VPGESRLGRFVYLPPLALVRQAGEELRLPRPFVPTGQRPVTFNTSIGGTYAGKLRPLRSRLVGSELTTQFLKSLVLRTIQCAKLIPVYIHGSISRNSVALPVQWSWVDRRIALLVRQTLQRLNLVAPILHISVQGNALHSRQVLGCLASK
jgi:hypothetical protein